jgi:2-polyprenyl-6-methoxyphenol hydroxylase-like FAD-dependent oxidoreductase
MANAIVIGGSLAGLMAASVAAEHYEDVSILDRDNFPDSAAPRRGVPQGRHTHGLLASGCNAIEELFPRISAELLTAGAHSGDLTGDGRYFFEAGWHAVVTRGITALLMSRPLLEETIRKRVLALPNVGTRQNCVVVGLVARDGNVTGVRLTGGEMLSANLVIDATGRASHSAEWLEGIGYARAPEERIELQVGYTTRQFRRKPGDLNGALAVLIPFTPEGKRSGVMTAIEGDRWTVGLGSRFRNYLPQDLAGFIEFARTLPAPDIYNALLTAEPLGSAFSIRFPASVRRRYESLERFPEGYQVIGDALSSADPAFAQGVSSVALQALELAKTLREGRGTLTARFFPRAAKIAGSVWNTAAANDLRIPEVAGRRTAKLRFVNWCVSRLHKAAHRDPIMNPAD